MTTAALRDEAATIVCTGFPKRILSTQQQRAWRSPEPVPAFNAGGRTVVRNSLLLTTALVVVSSLSLFIGQSAALARTTTFGLGRNTNDEFLQTYACGKGFRVEYWHTHMGSSSNSSGWTHVAVPIVGHGRNIHQIVVTEGYSSSSLNFGTFSAGIYSNTPSGMPGKLIAGGTQRAPQGCGKITFSIQPTRLSRNTKYWVEETGHIYGNLSSYQDVSWLLDRHSKRSAYVQSHHWLSGYKISSSTTPWTLKKRAPYLRLK